MSQSVALVLRVTDAYLDDLITGKSPRLLGDVVFLCHITQIPRGAR